MTCLRFINQPCESLYKIFETHFSGCVYQAYQEELVPLLKRYRALCQDRASRRRFPLYLTDKTNSRMLTSSDISLFFTAIGYYANDAFQGLPALASCLHRFGYTKDAKLIEDITHDELGEEGKKQRPHKDLLNDARVIISKICHQQDWNSGSSNISANEEVQKWRDETQQRVRTLHSMQEIDTPYILQSIMHTAMSECLAAKGEDGDTPSHIQIIRQIIEYVGGNLWNRTITPSFNQAKRMNFLMWAWHDAHNSPAEDRNNNTVEEDHALQIQSVLRRHLEEAPPELALQAFKKHVQQEAVRDGFWRGLTQSMSQLSKNSAHISYTPMTRTGQPDRLEFEFQKMKEFSIETGLVLAQLGLSVVGGLALAKDSLWRQTHVTTYGPR